MSKTDRARKRAAARAAANNNAKPGKPLPKGVMPLRAIGRREKDGREHRPQAARDPQADMLKARCRRWGKPSSQWREMRDPWWGCEAGGAMAKATEALPPAMRLRARAAYWDAICWARRTIAAFDRAMGAPNRHAQVLRLLLPLEELSADSTTPTADERTDEEKLDAAVREYMRLQEWIGRGGPAVAREALAVIVDDQPCRDMPCLMMALAHISQGIDPTALT